MIGNGVIHYIDNMLGYTHSAAFNYIQKSDELSYVRIIYYTPGTMVIIRGRGLHTIDYIMFTIRNRWRCTVAQRENTKRR